tara:strand:+ start:22 stop:1941 length:1920 start_codon:yes stop_codon:yes gene_type:complete
MNFMNRQMFANGNEVSSNPYFYIDFQGQRQYLDEKKLLPILRKTDVPALEALIQNPDVTYSPATQEVFRKVVGERKSTLSSTDPSLFEFGTFLPDNLTGISALRDIAGTAGDFTGQIAEGAFNLGRGVVSGFQERSYDEPEFAPQDIFPSERFPNVPDTMTGRPGNDEGFMSGFNESGILRRGYTNPQLASILSRGKSEIEDFSKDIEAIEQPVVEAVETKDVLDQPTVIEELPTLEPVTDSETLGVMSPLESTRRRLAYESEMIGRDEFGNILPEGRLLQDPTIAKALEELTPIESLVDINKTEADSLLETQEKFSPTIDLTKVDLNKVDTTKTEDRDTARSPRVPKETTGLFGSDRFLDFIRNVGAGLAESGQIGEGLVTGAAKAGEERAARDLMEQQEQKKYDRDLALAVAVEKAKSAGDNTPDIMKPEKILELNNDVKRDITDFQGGLAGVGFVDYAIEIIEDAEATGKPVGGLGGFIASLVDKGYAFVGMGKDFDSLSADSKVAELTKVVKQKNLQAILGESGRTISDKDRIIIEKVFGDLSAFESVSSVLGKLKESRRGLAESNAERYGNIQTNSDFLLAQGSYGKRFYTDMLPSLKSILGIDPYASQSASARATFGGQPIGAGSQSITDIDL